MALPQSIMDRLWQALTLDSNGNVAFRTTAASIAALAVKNESIDWGLGAHQVSAVYMPIADAGSYFTTDNVEAALQQLGAAVGGGGAPTAATYILQTANGSLPNAQAMGALSTGLVKNTTTTGVQSIATAGTDYYAPGSTDVALLDGGTNASLTASNGGIFYSTASAGAILAGTATARQMLQSGASGAPAWSTTTWPATTTINRILYSSSANVIGEITTVNSGLLVTSSGGVPSIATDIPTAVTIGGAAIYRAGGTDIPLLDGGTNASLTADLGGIVYSTASAFAILASTATAGKHLQSGASAAPSWTTATFPSTATSAGKLLRADGTNWVATTLTMPDTAAISTLIYASASNTLAALATVNNSILTTSATGVPTWLASVNNSILTTNSSGLPTLISSVNSAILNTNASGVVALTATPIIGTSMTIGIAGTNTGLLKLTNSSNSNLVTIQALAGGGTYTLTLPTDDGTPGQSLVTDGSGVLSWATGGVGAMFGSGSDGAVTWSADTNLDPTAQFNYTSATLNVSKILSVSSVNHPLVINTVGNVTINGTIDLNGKGGAGGAAKSAGTNSPGNSGTGGIALFLGTFTGGGIGGLGSGVGNAGAGGGGASMMAAGNTGASGTAAGGAGGSLATAGQAILATLLRGVCCGAGGASGGLSNSSSSTGKGGDGGGALVWFIGGNLTLGASSFIQCAGTAGAEPPTGPNTGSGGGGAGIILIIVAGTITDGGVTLSAAGGLGSASGGSAGGTGATGKIIIYSLSTGTTITAG